MTDDPSGIESRGKWEVNQSPLQIPPYRQIQIKLQVWIKNGILVMVAHVEPPVHDSLILRKNCLRFLTYFEMTLR